MASLQVKAMPLRLTWDQEFRFWSHVSRSGEDECWHWSAGSKVSRPKFTLNGKEYAASRIAYFLKFKIDPGLQDVLHTCNNGQFCVNWKHLYLGSDSENKLDFYADGGTNGRAKLTEQQVREIRLLNVTRSLTHKQIATMFGVTTRTITDILLGLTWKGK